MRNSCRNILMLFFLLCFYYCKNNHGVVNIFYFSYRPHSLKWWFFFIVCAIKFGFHRYKIKISSISIIVFDHSQTGFCVMQVVIFQIDALHLSWCGDGCKNLINRTYSCAWKSCRKCCCGMEKDCVNMLKIYIYTLKKNLLLLCNFLCLSLENHVYSKCKECTICMVRFEWLYCVFTQNSLINFVCCYSKVNLPLQLYSCR